MFEVDLIFGELDFWMIGYFVNLMFEVDLIFGELDFWMIGYFVNLIFGYFVITGFLDYCKMLSLLDIWLISCLVLFI